MFTIIGLGSTTRCLLVYLDKKYPQDCIFQTEETDKLIAEGIAFSDAGQPDPSLIQRIDETYAQKLFRRSTGIQDKNEDEIHIDFGDQSDDVSQLSHMAADKDMDILNDYFNRQNRGGDVSPFRTNTIISKVLLKKKETSIFGKYSGVGETTTNRFGAKIRNLSQGIANNLERKISEEVPFSKTTKAGADGGVKSFGDLVKHHSGPSNKLIKFPSEKDEDKFLSKIAFNQIIDEEQEGADSDDSELNTGKFNVKLPKDIKPHLPEEDLPRATDDDLEINKNNE
jgi:hypothetical protein